MRSRFVGAPCILAHSARSSRAGDFAPPHPYVNGARASRRAHCCGPPAALALVRFDEAKNATRATKAKEKDMSIRSAAVVGTGAVGASFDLRGRRILSACAWLWASSFCVGTVLAACGLSSGSTCTSAGGNCISSSKTCAELAPLSAQDCYTNGQTCCLIPSSPDDSGPSCTVPITSTTLDGGWVCEPSPSFQNCTGSTCVSPCMTGQYFLDCAGPILLNDAGQQEFPDPPAPPVSLGCVFAPTSDTGPFTEPSNAELLCCSCGS